MKKEEIKTAEFAEMLDLLQVYSEAANALSQLESSANEELLQILEEHKPEYAQLQEAMVKAETAVEVIVRKHPEWFAPNRKSIKTPFGTSKLHSSTKLVSVNEEATCKLLRAEEKADPNFKAADYIRTQESPNFEALEGLDDTVLSKFMIKRVREDKFSIVPATVDMGQAVKEAAEHRAGGAIKAAA